MPSNDTDEPNQDQEALTAAEKLATETNDALSKRQQIRFKTIFGGKVRYQGKTKKCLIFDLSEGGAKLQNVDGMPLNQEFDLFIDRLGAFKAIKAEAMWNRDERMGIRFIEEPIKLRLMLMKLLPSRYKEDNKA